MTPKTYPLLERCIEEGLRLGWNRAHKHTNTPTDHIILEEQSRAIMNEICEWFDFTDQFE